MKQPSQVDRPSARPVRVVGKRTLAGECPLLVMTNTAVAVVVLNVGDLEMIPSLWLRVSL